MKTNLADDPVLTTEELATWLKVKPQTIAKNRSLGLPGVPYVKVGRSVRYRMSEVQTYLERNSFGRSEPQTVGR